MASSNVGRFVWYELLTPDPAAAIPFYGEVVGWKAEAFGSDYMMWVGSQGPLGGVFPLPAEAAKMGAPPHWMASVQVANVDASVELVKKLGGKIYKEAADIPTVGRFAVAADPQGAVIDLFQPASEMKLHDRDKPGEFCWNELYTSDQPAAFQFYSQVFGWQKLEEMDMGPMGTYLLFGVDGVRLGGMMKKPDAMPVSAWGYYVEVADLDGAAARAQKLGAKTLNGPMDVPGGRVVQMMDPQGAAFALHQLKR